MATAIHLEGKATIRNAEKIQSACQEAFNAEEPTVEINWGGCLSIDTSVLQILLAVSRKKQIQGAGEVSEAVQIALAAAGFDSNLKPTSNPE